ncbi:MAG: rod shape-determining protein MreC [Alphaproteobacteria bacterium]|nr:rod shape-determining protein MreC [Alphaproteobacteria bacterium]HCP00977.1 rod shape-determining protein MreC [Rhodospirillaceae bacterium]
MPVRVWGQRFAFLALIALSFALMFLNKAEPEAFERARTVVVDAVTPVLNMMSRPVEAGQAAIISVESFFLVRTENARLQEENARLLHWVQVARQLGVENATLRAQLDFVPDIRPRAVTARVVADTGGAFFHSLLIDAGAQNFVRRGQAVVSHGALLGRVAEVGQRSARVLVLTDLNSRIPAIVESTGDRVIVTGNNTPWPDLTYLEPNSPISVGDRIITSGHGGVFPPGLMIGLVVDAGEGRVSIQPAVPLARVSEARVLDYGVNGILPSPENMPARPDAPAAVGTTSGGSKQ